MDLKNGGKFWIRVKKLSISGIDLKHVDLKLMDFKNGLPMWLKDKLGKEIEYIAVIFPYR